MSPLILRQILFPTDFSEVSRRAGRTAADLARLFKARLHVVHVIPPVTDPVPSSAALDAAIVELGPGLTIVRQSLSGVAARQIVAYAARADIDLIVLGTHGRTGVSHALLGSVAEAVVRRAPCRVLTVPSTAPAVDVEAPAPAPEQCIVCAKPTPDLICEPCRALIRGEALERKRGEERAGRAAG